MSRSVIDNGNYVRRGGGGHCCVRFLSYFIAAHNPRMIPKFTVDVLTFVTTTVHPISIYYKNKVKKTKQSLCLGKSLSSKCVFVFGI